MSRTLWIACSLFILYAGTLPFHFTGDWGAVGRKWDRVSWSPVVSPLTGGPIRVVDTVQNVMLFVPFGALGSVALRRSIRSAGVRMAIATVAGAVLSAAVEALQLFTVNRTTSTADLVTNTLGALGGAAGAEVLGRVLRGNLPRVRQLVQHPRAFYPFVVASVVVCISAWQPFDVRMDVGHVGGVAKRLLRDPWQVAGFRDEAAAVLQYALFAAALSHWLAAEGVRRVPFIATAVGIGVAAALEASQLVIDSRMPAGADFAVRAFGVVLGTAVWRVWPRRSSAWVGVVVLMTAAAAAMQMWNPYRFAGPRRAFSWFPFLPYYESNWFPILSHSIELMLLYFPLGFAIGLVSPPRRAAVWSVAAAIAIAVPVEYVQSWVVTRYPSVTDLAVSVLGAVAGVWTATRGARAFDTTLAAAS